MAPTKKGKCRKKNPGDTAQRKAMPGREDKTKIRSKYGLASKKPVRWRIRARERLAHKQQKKRSKKRLR